jgi:hypothetical protein
MSKAPNKSAGFPGAGVDTAGTPLIGTGAS